MKPKQKRLWVKKMTAKNAREQIKAAEVEKAQREEEMKKLAAEAERQRKAKAKAKEDARKKLEEENKKSYRGSKTTNEAQK